MQVSCGLCSERTGCDEKEDMEDNFSHVQLRSKKIVTKNYLLGKNFIEKIEIRSKAPYFNLYAINLFKLLS